MPKVFAARRFPRYNFYYNQPKKRASGSRRGGRQHPPASKRRRGRIRRMSSRRSCAPFAPKPPWRSLTANHDHSPVHRSARESMRAPRSSRVSRSTGFFTVFSVSDSPCATLAISCDRRGKVPSCYPKSPSRCGSIVDARIRCVRRRRVRRRCLLRRHSSVKHSVTTGLEASQAPPMSANQSDVATC